MPCLSKILDKRGIPFNTQTNTPMTTKPIKLNIVFNRSEDENGYATFSVAPYRRAGQDAKGFNPILRGIEIREWSSGSNGGLNHYFKKDKPVGRSVWKHSLRLTTFTSYDDCKQDLLAVLIEHLNEYVTI